jgi:hypothetical protein
VCSRGRAVAGAQVASRRKAHHGSSRTVFHEGSGQARGTLTHRPGVERASGQCYSSRGAAIGWMPASGLSHSRGQMRWRRALSTAGSDMPFAPPGRLAGPAVYRRAGRATPGDPARRSSRSGVTEPGTRAGPMPEQSASVFCRYPHRHEQELLLDPARRGQPPPSRGVMSDLGRRVNRSNINARHDDRPAVMTAFISSSSGPPARSARPCVVTRRIWQMHPGGRDTALPA